MKPIHNPPCNAARCERSIRLVTAVILIAASLLLSMGCSSDKGDKEPTVTVQVAPVEKTTIEHTISARAQRAGRRARRRASPPMAARTRKGRTKDWYCER